MSVLDRSTDLSLERTRAAYDRTLMAWIRTSMAMISFGFSIWEFFRYLSEPQAGATQGLLGGPRFLSLALIGVGTLALALAATYISSSSRLGAAHAPPPED